MEKVIKFLSDNIWFLIIIFSLPAVWSLLVPGFYGASDDMHIARLFEMDQLIKIGQIPPRFVPDLSFGFGYPLFNFVFPLPYYVGEIFHLLGFTLVDSIKIIFALTIPFSALFMYYFLRQLTLPALSFLGAIVYIYTPYRSTDIYVRGAIGEALAFVFFPLLCLIVIKLSQNSFFNFRWISIGSLTLAFLVLSHNIATYMFFPFFLALGIVGILFISKKPAVSLISFILTIFFGLLISSYFWLPALTDSGLITYNTIFNIVDHFPTIKQLMTPYWGYGVSVPGPYDGMSFFIGTVNLIILVLGTILLIICWKQYSILQKLVLIWVEVSFLTSFFMMNNRSLFIWNTLPLLPYFQFPWRFLMMTTFLTPIFCITLEKLKFKTFLALGFIFLTIILNVSFFRPHDFLRRIDSYYLNRYIPIPVASSEYLVTGEEYARLLKTSKQFPDKNYPLVTAEGNIKVKNTDGLNSVIEISSEKDILLNYNKFYFPGWQAKIDGKSANLFAVDPFGQIGVPIPAGFHEINIAFGETNFKIILDILSLATFFLAIYLSVRNIKDSAIMNKDE